MKPIDIKSNSYAEYNVDSNAKDPKFEIGYHLRITRYKNIFAKGYALSWSETVFVISKIKNNVPWTYIVLDLNGEDIVGTIYEKELQKTSHEEFRIEKVIKRKGNKLYLKWNDYHNSFNN